MGWFFLITSLFILVYSIFSIHRLNKLILTPIADDEKSIVKAKLVEYVENLYSFYSGGMIYVFVFNAVSLSIVYFIDKIFFLSFLYGSVLSLLFVFIDVILNYIQSIYFYPHIISNQNLNAIKRIFGSLKGLLFISLMYLIFILFSRFLQRIDYAVVFAGSCFSAFSVYICSVKYKKINYFLNFSYFSILFSLSLLLFMRFGFVKYFETILLVFFVYYISKTVNFLFADKIKFIKNENISSVLIFFVLYLIFTFIIFIHQYQNMFLFLGHIVSFSIFYFFLRLNFIGFNKAFVIFSVIIITKIISFLAFKVVDGFSIENLFFFIVSLNISVVYDYIKEIEFLDLKEFNKSFMNGEWTKEVDIYNFKIPFMVMIIFFYIVFSSMYNLMNTYYGYSDSYDMLVFFVSVLVFYFYETFSDRILVNIEKNLLNFIFNVSISVFVFSFVIVIISYSFKIGFINLYGAYLILGFLVLMLSKKYYSYLVSLFYLSFFYILSYVRS